MRWILENRQGWSVSKPVGNQKKLGNKKKSECQQKKSECQLRTVVSKKIPRGDPAKKIELLCFVPKAS
jgi:hypothetical protein